MTNQAMTEQAVTEAAAGLAAKFDALDLSADEEAILGVVLGRAAEAGREVEGFGVVYEIETNVKSGQPMGRQPGQSRWAGPVSAATGVDPSKLSVWTDMRP